MSSSGELTCAVSCVLRGGVDVDGVVLSGKVMAERVGFLAGLSGLVAAGLLSAHWNARNLSMLAAGVGPDGRRLPSKAHVAVRRLGWTGTGLPAGVYVPERVLRVGWELGMRLMKNSVYKDAVIKAVVASWPKDPNKRTKDEWVALDEALRAQGVEASRVIVRGRTRQVYRFLAEQGRLPASIVDLEGPPRIPDLVLLAAADKQLVSLSRDGAWGVLEVKLPLVPLPQSVKDWQWVTARFAIPGHVPTNAQLHTPTLRLTPRGVRVDLPFDRATPATILATAQPSEKKPAGPLVTRAVGFDWGVNMLLTGSAAGLVTQEPHPADEPGLVRTSIVADGKPAHFGAGTLTRKQSNRRRLSEQLTGKIDRITNMIAGTPVPYALNEDLVAKRELLTQERNRVNAKRRNTNKALAWTAATWAVDYAVSENAQAVFVEDLTSMESKGLGRKTNARVASTVRTELFKALDHQAAKCGIALVQVPAKDTSSTCPYCLGVLTHQKASNDKSQGYRWAVCSCGFSADRDHAASLRVVARGLSSQEHIRTPKRGLPKITKIIDHKIEPELVKQQAPTHKAALKPVKPIRPSRDKTSPTPRQTTAPRTRRARLTSPTPATSAPSVPVKRPAGPSPSALWQAGRTKLSTRVSSKAWRARGRGLHPHTHPTAVPRAQAPGTVQVSMR